jgi:predicted nucleic-acid-binding protein
VIGVDTNVLIRWLVDDGTSPGESAAASEVMASEGVHVSAIALAETIWVLTKVYKRPGAEVVDIFRSLLHMPHLTIESSVALTVALSDFEQHGGDLNDHLIAAHDERAGCLHTVTFDRKAARSGRFRLLSQVRWSSGLGEP